MKREKKKERKCRECITVNFGMYIQTGLQINECYCYICKIRGAGKVHFSCYLRGISAYFTIKNYVLAAY